MSGETLLVVEDNRTTASIMQLKLQKMGYQVPSPAINGDEAIEQAQLTKPTLVLMDIDLGQGKDGIEVAEIIKDRFKIPVVFVTSYSDERTLARAKNTSPLGYINKPLRDNDLRTTIELALDKVNVDSKTLQPQQPQEKKLLGQNPEITCDVNGAVRDYNLGARHAMKTLELRHPEELLPYNHRQIVEYSLRIDNSYLVAGRLMDQIFSWEYIPNNANNTVKVICEDLTHDRNLSYNHSTEDALKQTLNYLSVGVILINRRLEPTFVNNAAKNFINKENHLAIIGDILSLPTQELNAELYNYISDAKGGVISMNKYIPTSQTELLISPIKNNPNDNVDTLPVSIIFIFHGHKDSERFEEILKALYNFSNAEARLAAALVQDPRLEQAANSIGIKINTARSHLKKIFQKTGTDRQSSLINHIVSGPAGLIIKTGNL